MGDLGNFHLRILQHSMVFSRLFGVWVKWPFNFKFRTENHLLQFPQYDIIGTVTMWVMICTVPESFCVSPDNVRLLSLEFIAFFCLVCLLAFYVTWVRVPNRRAFLQQKNRPQSPARHSAAIA